MSEPQLAVRDAEIIGKYISGIPTTKLDKEYGITRERVCQILRRGNVIEHVRERRRLAREAFSEEAERIKGEIKQRRADMIAQALALVQSGQSIRAATMSLGLSRTEANLFGLECRKAGIKTQHGRFRDFTERLRICEGLAAQGMNITEIVKAMRADNDPHIHAGWIYKHLPQLKRVRQPMSVPGEATTRAPRTPKPQEYLWTDEAIVMLRDLWIRGCTAQQIADILNTTRNSVIGKVNRLRAQAQLFIAPA